MFTTQLAFDLMFVALVTGLTLLGARGVRAAARRLNWNANPVAPSAADGPAFVLVVALLSLLGVHVFRTGTPSHEASNRVERVNASDPSSQDGNAPGFLGARMGTVVGRSTLDLRQASIGPGDEAAVSVFVAMGRVTLRVPDGWEVDTQSLPRSVVEDKRRPAVGGEVIPAASGPPPRLVLSGFVMLGTVELVS